MARQRLGQHFLADAGWREKIARAIRVSRHGMEMPNQAMHDENRCWIEIGSGHGEMTEYLVATGLPVLAVELDEPLIQRLQKMAEAHRNLTIVPGDVLQTDLGKLADGRRMRIYGNLPYYITSPILNHLFAFADQIEEIHVVIQDEVAMRLAAKPGTSDYGYLSVLTQFYARPERILMIPRGAFSPPPEVDSALVSMRLPGERATLGLQNPESFLNFTKLCFGQKRKKLTNNLKPMAKPDATREALQSLHLREDARAEQLSVAELAALHGIISSGKQPGGPDNPT